MTNYVEIVDSEEKQNIYDDIWTFNWLQEGYDLEYSEGELLQYFFRNKKNLPVGTVEILFEPKIIFEEKVLEKVNFLDFIDISEKIAEVDKLSVLKKHRNDYFVLKNIMTVIIAVGKIKNIDKIIALFEPKLFGALKKSGVPVIPFGEPFLYKGGMVQAGAVDIKKRLGRLSEKIWINKELEREMMNQEIQHTL